MIRSGHIDSFTRDRLPRPEQMPDFSYDRPELTYPERLNAAAALLDVWRERGWDERPCVIGNGDVWSYGRFRDTVDRIARLLAERFGIVPGNRVLVRGTNTPMLAACWLAVLKAGAVVVPTMPLLRATELESILERAAVSLALCDARFAKDLNAAAQAMDGSMPVVTFNGGDLEGRLEETETGFAAVDTAADDVALIAFTSGTTGKPKATAHFHRDLLAVADLSPQSLLKTGGDDVFCGTPSLAFAYGQGGMLLFPLRVGASVVLLDRATPERLLEVTAKHKATVMFTVPTVYRAMTARIERTRPWPRGCARCAPASRRVSRCPPPRWRAGRR